MFTVQMIMFKFGGLTHSEGVSRNTAPCALHWNMARQAVKWSCAF